MQTPPCAFMHEDTYTHTHTHTHTHHARIYAHTHTMYVYTHTHTHIYTHIHTHTMHAYTHTPCIHTHTHTHKHTHTHIHTPFNWPSRHLLYVVSCNLPIIQLQYCTLPLLVKFVWHLKKLFLIYVAIASYITTI